MHKSSIPMLDIQKSGQNQEYSLCEAYTYEILLCLTNFPNILRDFIMCNRDFM